MVFKFTALDADIDQVKIIDRYTVCEAQVFITSTGQYLIKEPPLSEEEYEIYAGMIEHLMNSLPFIDTLETDGEKMHHLETHIWKEAQETGQVASLSFF